MDAVQCLIGVPLAILLFWGALLGAGILTVRANATLDSQLASWTGFRGWVPVTAPPLLLRAAEADRAVVSFRGSVAGRTCTAMYVTGFESYFLACALELPGNTGVVELRPRGRLSYASLRVRAGLKLRRRSHSGLPEPEVLDLGFERAYRLVGAIGPAAALLTPRVRRSLALAAAAVPVRKVSIVDDLVMITATTWTVHGHLDPIVNALTAIAQAAPAELQSPPGT